MSTGLFLFSRKFIKIQSSSLQLIWIATKCFYTKSIESLDDRTSHDFKGRYNICQREYIIIALLFALQKKLSSIVGFQNKSKFGQIKKTITAKLVKKFLILFSINLLAFYHECRSLIGYPSWRFRGVSEEYLDKVLND